jgi:hypothetical protein
MDYFAYLFAGAALIVLAINILATFRLLREKSFTALQKGGQLLFLWSIPIVGFVFVWHFLNEVAPPRVTTDVRTWLESDEISVRLSNIESSDSGAPTGGHNGD